MRGGALRYGDESIRYEVIERPARRTLGIEVHPDGRVRVLAPRGCDNATIEDKLRRRAGWVSRQRATFTHYGGGAAPRQYLSGESHRYLGRQYRLRVEAHAPGALQDEVKLARGQMRVAGPGALPPARVEELLRRWYLARAREVFGAVLAGTFAPFARLGRHPPRIAIRRMRSRWGSLSPRGRMTLNARLIRAPRPCIEYVIVHELCHLIHKNHSAAFFALLGRAMPDWRERKQRLEQVLI